MTQRDQIKKNITHAVDMGVNAHVTAPFNRTHEVHIAAHLGQSDNSVALRTLPNENMLEDTDGLLRPPFVRGGRSNPAAWPLGAGSLLLSVSADVRSSDDVIAFEGLENL